MAPTHMESMQEHNRNSSKEIMENRLFLRIIDNFMMQFFNGLRKTVAEPSE